MERERGREGERKKQWRNGEGGEERRDLEVSVAEGSHLEEGGQKGAREWGQKEHPEE